MKSNNASRGDLIKELYNSYHEGEAALPDIDKSRGYVFDEGTGTLYCQENDKEYESNKLSDAAKYFNDIAASIEATLSTSADPYKQGIKAEYCHIAAEAIEYMFSRLSGK